MMKLYHSLSPFLLASYLAAGCGGATPPPEPKTAPPPAKAPEKVAKPPAKPAPQKKLPFEVRATAKTEDTAYAQARERLLLAVLNDESLTANDPFAVKLAEALHDREADIFDSSTDASGVNVHLGLEEEALEAALGRVEQAIYQVKLPDTPEVLRQAILDVRVARLQARICERKKTLLPSAECEINSTDPAEKILVQLLEGVDLSLAYDGGIPFAGGKFLRPLRARASLVEFGRDQWIAGLPLLLTVGGVKDAPSFPLVTNEKGWVEFDLSKTSPRELLTVELDIKRISGMPQLELEPPTLKPAPRAVGMQRSLLIVRKSNPAGNVALSKLEKGLRHLRSEAPDLSASDVRALAALPAHKWKGELPHLADVQEGKLDLVIFIEAESEFASRMGTHRVWFEARGKASVVNAWNGKVLFEVDALTTESGVGESRAESAAREVIGEKLADKLKDGWKKYEKSLDPPEEAEAQGQAERRLSSSTKSLVSPT